MTDTLTTLISGVLADAHPEWGSLTFDSIGGGIEFSVFRSSLADGRSVVFRAMEHRFSSNDNDPEVDARRLMKQEAEIAGYLAPREVPVAAIVDFVLDDRVDVLVTEYVDNDDSAIEVSAALDALDALHSLRAPTIELVATEAESLARTLAERTDRRLTVLEELRPGEIVHRPTIEQMAAAAELEHSRESLLHLDFRSDNILTRDQQVVALIDWTNALIGPPSLEFARLAEYGEFEVPSDRFAGCPKAAELMFRLDTAVMLAVVFVSEAPSPDDAARLIARTNQLVAEFESIR